MNIRDLIEKIEPQEIRPENGAVLIYVGVVKGVKDSKKIEKIEVVHDNDKIMEEINKKFKNEIEKGLIKIKLIDGTLTPGEPITIVQIQDEDRYSAVMKLLKIIDIIKKNSMIREYYVDEKVNS